ncbi:MAG: HAD-IA family hydrolase [Bacteroidales bacterium]|nr:HAD-IA family hydrolase [Bacteroidales bacterium]
MIKNIIFDFDGTLADTASLIVKTMQETIRQMELPPKTDEECQATIGLRLEDVPAKIWPELGDIGSEYAQKYRTLFNELKRPFDVKMYAGVIETLRALHDRGINMAIASSRSHTSLKEYIEQFNLVECFEMLVGGNDVANGKPAPDPVLSITDKLGWDVGETLTVGDAAVDILMGQAACTETCAVTYGNGNAKELEAVYPTYIIDVFPDLLQCIEG